MKKRITGLVALVLAGAVLWACGADEITVNTYLAIKNGGYDFAKNINQLKRDQTGTSASMAVQSIQTNAYEALTIATDVGNQGYAFFRNITTNATWYVDIGVDDPSLTNLIALVRLEALDVALFRLHPTTVVYAQANGGSVDLEFWVLED